MVTGSTRAADRLGGIASVHNNAAYTIARSENSTFAKLFRPELILGRTDNQKPMLDEAVISPESASSDEISSRRFKPSTSVFNNVEGAIVRDKEVTAAGVFREGTALNRTATALETIPVFVYQLYKINRALIADQKAHDREMLHEYGL